MARPTESGPNRANQDTTPLLDEAARLRLIEENVRDYAIFTMDPEGVVATWNLGAERILGFTEEEMVGRKGRIIFTPEDLARDEDRKEIETARANGRAEDERWHLKKDGSRFWGSGILTALRDEQGTLLGYCKILRDLTDRKLRSAELEEERRTTASLHRVGVALSAELDLQRLVQTLTDEARALVGAQFGSYFYNLVDERGESYALYTVSGAPREAFSGMPMPRNTEIFAPTFRGEGPVRSDDITLDPRYGRSDPYFGMPEGHLPVRSYLAVPVVSRSGEVLGGLFFGHAEPGVFTERHERALTTVAAHAAVAIDNARLYQEAQRELAERTRVEAEITALNERLRRAMTETHHRIKNNLQVISALVDIQMNDAGAMVPVSELRRIGQHIRVLAVIHDLLTAEAKDDPDARSVSAAEALGNLLPLLQSMVGERQLRFKADDFRLSARQGTALAELVNECVSNAVKHGRGDVEVTLNRDDGEARLEICDDGPGYPPSFDPLEAAHTGLELVESLARWDLQGHTAYENREQGGARVVVTFPVSGPSEGGEHDPPSRAA